jgi:hypothetical protein
MMNSIGDFPLVRPGHFLRNELLALEMSARKFGILSRSYAANRR